MGRQLSNQRHLGIGLHPFQTSAIKHISIQRRAYLSHAALILTHHLIHPQKIIIIIIQLLFNKNKLSCIKCNINYIQSIIPSITIHSFCFQLNSESILVIQFYNIVSETFKEVSETCNEVSGTCNEVSETSNKVSGMSNKVSETYNKVSGTCNKVSETSNKVSGTSNKVSVQSF